MIRIAGISMAMLGLVACQEGLDKKIARHYGENRQALVVEKEVNSFSLQLAYVPMAMMPGATDTAYYSFRLQVQCPQGSNVAAGDKTALYYGLDTLFALGDKGNAVYPVSVQPVITGSSKHFEYLLVFPKEHAGSGGQMVITFSDRLFTNTKMNFVFDRNRIEATDKLHS